MRRLIAPAAAIALGLATGPRTAGASPQDLFGFGPRSVAMGGTGASFIADYAAVHANPAGLARARERALTLGVAAVGFDLWTQRGDESRAPQPVERGRATTIGLTLPLPLGGELRDRVGLGLGFYLPTDVVVRGRILRAQTPQFLVLSDRVQSIALQLGLGADLGAGFRVGAGFAALAAITGTVLIATDAAGRVGARVDNQLVASYAPVAGASWDHGRLRIAAVARGTLVARFGVQIEARDIGLPLPVFNISGVAQYDPWQVGLEAAFVDADWTLALATTFKRWSEYPGPAEATTMGSPTPPAVGFHDTAVGRFGIERAIRYGTGRLALRAGYFFEPSPAPPAAGVANYLDNDRHVATAGVGIGGSAVGTRFDVEVFGQAHALATRSVEKAPNVLASNPGAPRISYGGAMYLLGVNATVTF